MRINFFHIFTSLLHGEQRCSTNNRFCITGCTTAIPKFWSMMYIIPVLHDVHYSYYAWCTLFLFSMMYIIPVWHDVYYSCYAWCTLFLYYLMYIIPVLPDVPYSRLPCCTLFCCMLICFICFFKLAWCTLFLYSMSYLILVYTNPISEILDVVYYSDVYSSAPPLSRLGKADYLPLWTRGTQRGGREASSLR